MENHSYEMGPEEIAEIIFSKPPGDINSINLQLEDQTAEFAEREGIEQFTSNILKIITMAGVSILYGKNINFMNLTGDQVTLIKQYTRSYGYNLKASVNDENQQLHVYFERTFI